MRLTCRSCGAAWTAERRERCAMCGGQDVTAISLNATIGALADSRRGAERLTAGIHEHLDDLGTFLASVRGRRGRSEPPKGPQ